MSKPAKQPTKKPPPKPRKEIEERLQRVRAANADDLAAYERALRQVPEACNFGALIGRLRMGLDA